MTLTGGGECMRTEFLSDVYHGYFCGMACVTNAMWQEWMDGWGKMLMGKKERKI
jgi:hypothetical protein